MLNKTRGVWKTLARSILFAVCCLLAIVVVNFFLPRLMPGDPVLSLIGAEDEQLTQEEYDYYYTALGLDKPLGEQFGDYIANLFQGKLGYSFHYGKDVGAVLAEKIPRTMQIALPAWIISALLAYFLGTSSGYKKARLKDTLISDSMILVNTAPTFLVAILMVVVFAYELHILPYGGLNSTILPDTAWGLFWDRIAHLILPVATMVIVSTPSKYIMLRETTAKAVDEKYVLYAKARGLKDRNIKGRHIFTNVGQPFITMLGSSFGKMLSGSIIVEMIFSIDGMGLLVNSAINKRDFAILQGALLLIAVSVIFANLIADLLCALIDPRRRLEADK